MHHKKRERWNKTELGTREPKQRKKRLKGCETQIKKGDKRDRRGTRDRSCDPTHE